MFHSLNLVNKSIGGIILAAGDSSRFGQPKQLLDYHGQPIIRYIAKTALTAGLHPIVVVSGHQADQIEQEIQDLSIIISRNSKWHEGQSTSIVAGIKSLPQDIDAVLFLLGDQPQITVAVIKAAIAHYLITGNLIVITEIQGIRSHPVLFDKTTFKDLLKLKGDIGGRQIFNIHRPSPFPWQDERLLMDIDTPYDYENLISGKFYINNKSGISH
jgi:molybdenum cofactor cytidylyltransferase